MLSVVRWRSLRQLPLWLLVCLIGSLPLIAAGCGASAEGDGLVTEDVEQSVTVPLRVCDKHPDELRLFAAYTSPNCTGAACYPTCSVASPTCPDGATCDTDAGQCKPTTCNALDDARCTGATHCNVAAGKCEWFSCTSDASCGCGSYCDVPTGRCRLSCLGGNDSGGLGLTCSSQQTCDGNGRCAPNNGIPLPDQDVVLAADPPAPAMTADNAGAWPVVNVTISLRTTSVVVGSALPSPVRVVPQDDLLVSCGSTGALSAAECTINGAGWTFTLQAGTYTASRVVRVQVKSGSVLPRWTLRLVTEDGAHRLDLFAPRIDHQGQPGRYVGTVTLGGGTPSTTLAIQATVTDASIMLHDPQHIIAPTGAVLIARNNTKTATSFLGGSAEQALYKQYTAAFHQLNATFDPVTGRLVGQLAVQLASSPQLNSTWSFTLDRVGALTTAAPCPSGEVLDSALGACVPGLQWDPAPDVPSTVTQAKATRWLSAMAPRMSDALLTSDSVASQVERLVCYDQSLSSNAGFLTQTSPVTGDLACAGPTPHGWWAIGLQSYQDRVGSTPPLTQSDMLKACMDQMTIDAPATELDLSQLTNDSCVSLARFYPALFTAAGALPYRYQTLSGFFDRRANLLFSRLLQQWAALTGFVARTGAAQRAAADMLSIVDQFTHGSMQPSETKLLNQSANLSYESVLDAVDSAWTLVLDKRIQGPLGTLLGNTVANPDYRQSQKPIANWTFLAADRSSTQIVNAVGGPPLAITNCIFGTGDANNFLGDSMIGQPRCLANAAVSVPAGDLTATVQVRKLFSANGTTLFDSDALVIKQVSPAAPGLAPYLQVGHRIANGTNELVTFRELTGNTLANSVIVIRRDARNRTYTLNVPGDPNLGRTRSYVSPPAVQTDNLLYIGSPRVGGDTSHQGAAANLKHVAIWNTVLSSLEVQALINRTTAPQSDAERAHPAWPGLALPDPADPTANEAALGLPAAWLESLIPTVNLVEAYVTDAAVTSHGACRESKVDDDLQRALERAARSLRLTLAIKSLAQLLHSNAVSASATPLTWEPRYTQAAAELDAVLARTVLSLTSAKTCENPMGLAASDAPLYFGTADTSTPGNLMQASSAVLKDIAGSAGAPASDIGLASNALTDARSAWRQQFTSGIQDQIGANDDTRRLDGIRSSFGSELVDLCGVTTDSASAVLTRFIDPASPNPLTAANCHIQETNDCAGSESAPLDQIRPACVRGEIGEALLAAVAAGQRVQRAQLGWDAARATADQWNKHCATLDASITGKQDALNELEGYQVVEENEALYLQMFNVAYSAAMLGGGAGKELNRINDQFGDRYSANVAQRKSDLRKLLQGVADNQLSEDCWSQASLAAIPIAGAEQDFVAARADLNTAFARLQSLQGRVAAKVLEAKAAISRETGLVRPRLAFHYWADELLELYQRRMARARRTTYLFLRAVEHDLQRNYGLDSAVINATHPQQLDDIATGLRDELLHGMEARKPEPVFGVLSLCEQVLRLPELLGEHDCSGPKSQRRFREILFSPANAMYENGAYLGQSIPFRLTPADLGLTTLCAERLAEVDAHMTGQFGGALATVKLQKRETFYSETCVDHIDAIGPVQENTLHSATNLLRGGAVSAFTRDRDWTRVQIDAAGDATDPNFASRGAPGEHANSGLAGRGLFGDYALIVPSTALAGVIAANDLQDIKVRFDFVAIEDNGSKDPAGQRLLAVVLRDGAGAALPSASGNAVTAPCTLCDLGSAARLTATPAAGWHFGGWSGACAGAASTCDVTMTTKRTAWATFVDDRVAELQLLRGGTGSGGVAVGWDAAGAAAVPPFGQSDLPSTQALPTSTPVYLTAVPAPDSVFTGWSGGNGGAACALTGRCAFDPARGAATVVASFALKPKLMVNLDVGAGVDPYGIASVLNCRELTCTYPMEPNQTVQITQQVDNASSVGWRFTQWTGGCTGTGACQLVMDRDRSVTAQFRQ
jgi:hypothetical protein